MKIEMILAGGNRSLGTEEPVAVINHHFPQPQNYAVFLTFIRKHKILFGAHLCWSGTILAYLLHLFCTE